MRKAGPGSLARALILIAGLGSAGCGLFLPETSTSATSANGVADLAGTLLGPLATRPAAPAAAIPTAGGARVSTFPGSTPNFPGSAPGSRIPLADPGTGPAPVYQPGASPGARAAPVDLTPDRPPTWQPSPASQNPNIIKVSDGIPSEDGGVADSPATYQPAVYTPSDGGEAPTFQPAVLVQPDPADSAPVLSEA